MIKYSLQQSGLSIVPITLWLILAFIAVVIIYTVKLVSQLSRQSERQWKRVDKSKLREWDDEDD